MRIALLEGEPEQSQHLKGIICGRCQSCDASETGQDFLGAALHNNNDLLVLNCQISGMSGLSRRSQQAQVMAAHD
ncbi:response regulator transcription factor [Marinobacter sp. ELB17]|uniref:response regulator transcription factor n=1 Tax=Marinobacter sp. ELB17 TaxID=270374 RepID=UPI0000F38062|nr:response regulator transcription factor [Marinobacter sp. ELB17]EAZ99970.1 hypothetical protein MELB17_16453 [Marinobacter sp. ELB17]